MRAPLINVKSYWVNKKNKQSLTNVCPQLLLFCLRYSGVFWIISLQYISYLLFVKNYLPLNLFICRCLTGQPQLP